jgi:hypothetical protein
MSPTREKGARLMLITAGILCSEGDDYCYFLVTKWMEVCFFDG